MRPTPGKPLGSQAQISTKNKRVRSVLSSQAGTIYAEREVLQVVGRDRRARRGPALHSRTARRSVPTTSDRSLPPLDPPKFAVFESAQAGCHEPALPRATRSEEHTSELQSQSNLVC